MVDINQIELKKKELQALEAVDQQGCVSDEVMDSYPYDYLLRLDLLEHGYSAKYPYEDVPGVLSIPENVLQLSDPGRLFLARKRETRRSKRIEWVRYIITTGIAIAALIVAIVSLVKQAG